MTADRYLAIPRPLKYYTVMTRWKVVIMIFITWMIPTAISLFPSLWKLSGKAKRYTANRVFGGWSSSALK